ncbi:hypothetical protein [Kitasatospora camelliae]|uniref:PE family protein n=1 Tax=Kitasatospora camelliae TaxID=3156397 RepID=A0AAU8JQ84_9ACTN
MDTELKAIVDALRDLEKQIRDTVTAKARSRHGTIPDDCQEPLLGAVAAALEAMKGFTGIYPDRMYTPDARSTMNQVTRQLGDLADRLRAAQRRAAEGGR